MNDKKVIEKLKKIKELAEKGVGGEKEGAEKLYATLIEKYNIDENLINEELISEHWYQYKTNLEKDLLRRIFYTITGSSVYSQWIGRSANRKSIGIDCTEFEAVQIKIYFDFYRKRLEEELEIFMLAFGHANHLFPDKDARLYEEVDTKENIKKLSDEEKRCYKKAGMLSAFMDGEKPVMGIEANGGKKL